LEGEGVSKAEEAGASRPGARGRAALTPFEAALTPFEAALTPFEAALTPFEAALTPLSIQGKIRRVRNGLRRLLRIPTFAAAEAVAAGAVLRVVLGELLRAGRSTLRRLTGDLMRRERPLRIAVDIRPFYEPLTGVGWYLYEILQGIAADPGVEIVAWGDARITDDGPHLHAELPPDTVCRTFDLRGLPPSRIARPLTAAAYVLLMKLDRPDVVFGANFFLPRLMDAVAGRRVVTVHDLTYRKHPELLQKETLENLERQMARELLRADVVICVSESTRRDLLDEYEIDPSRAITVHNGIRPQPASGTCSTPLPARYILFVSTIEPRKNLGVLLDAFERLRAGELYQGDLVIVGRVGWKSEQTMKRIRTSRWRKAIHHLDYVPREDLGEIYRRAEIFVLPSRYEGFGLPVLEAMSHGTAVITTTSSSLPEVAGDAALLFDPDDAAALADAIDRIATDRELRERMVKKGLDRVNRFGWDRAADETLAVLRKVAHR
jgi:glycosyltransferase involved in cell wall biosynthesis